MKAEFMNPFLQATKEVFQQMMSLDIERGTIELRSDFITGDDANVLIGVVGSVAGMVLYSFPKQTALEMVKSLSGMEMNDLDVFVTSALGEVSNIISGNALSYLSKANYTCDIAPPQILLGNAQSISVVAPQSLYVGLSSPVGDFSMHVALAEK
jgi:chemotaxis protein CheX